jgi:hypothetical protein
MTVHERQRDRVAASLLFDGEARACCARCPVDPDTYMASAAVGCGHGALLGGGPGGGLPGTGRRSVDARSAR